jgi:hypothetical protein
MKELDGKFLGRFVGGHLIFDQLGKYLARCLTRCGERNKELRQRAIRIANKWV